MKRTIASLLMATALTGVWGAAPARAEPVTTFFTFVGAGFAAGGSVAVGAYAATAAGWGFAVGQFLAANLGTLVLAAGSLFLSAFNNQRAESSQVNFRQATPVRAHAAGLEHVGGAVLFASFDGPGNFWYLIGHCDSELMEVIETRLDDVAITVDGNNKVTTEAFIAEESNWIGWGSRKPFFSVWTCTFSPDDPVPELPASFKQTFPEWTDQYKLAGVTVSVVRIDAVKAEDRAGVYRWRGPIGLGEPAVSIVGIWNRIYDPRDGAQAIADRSTWKASTNAALIWAWHRFRPQGFNLPMDRIAWDKVAIAADICDQAVTDRYEDVAPRYHGGGFWEENLENIAVEQDILKGMDGVALFDDQGRAFCIPGHWYEPALALNASRDIFTMSDNEANDGESATDGVIVRYKEPGLGYVMQPCAPWHNPDFYVPGTEPKYLTIDAPFCKNHNQAVRLAKAYGRRAQPTRRIGPEVGIRGLRAKRERIIALDYDEAITGAWQVAVPVEVDPIGTRVALGLVPARPDDWDLLDGEEGEKPQPSEIVIDDTIPVPTGVVVFPAAIAGTGAASARLEATFDPPASELDSVEFQYNRVDRSSWLPMISITESTFAYSDPVDVGWDYAVQWRMRRGSRSTEWQGPQIVTVALDTTPPGNVTGVSAGGGAGQVTINWMAPIGNYAAARIYLNNADDAGAAQLVRIEPGPAGSTDSHTITGLAAGTYYAWVEAINGSVVPSASRVPTGSFTVT